MKLIEILKEEIIETQNSARDFTEGISQGVDKDELLESLKERVNEYSLTMEDIGDIIGGIVFRYTSSGMDVITATTVASDIESAIFAGIRYNRMKADEMRNLLGEGNDQ